MMLNAVGPDRSVRRPYDDEGRKSPRRPWGVYITAEVVGNVEHLRWGGASGSA